MIRVIIQDERGEPIDGGADIRSQTLPACDDLRFCCLRFVDPYGDTVFNHLQMDALLADLELWRTSAKDPDQRDQITQIERFARQCKDEPHLYLKFIGD